MSATTMRLDQAEEALLVFEVSDEALEIAAGATSVRVNFTLASCTGLTECPA
jgi:hypothetical protein